MSATPPLAFDPSLLELLACPICFGPLKIASTPDRIQCSGCLKYYCLSDGIPILIPGRADV